MKAKIKEFFIKLWAGVKGLLASLWAKFKTTKVFKFLRKWGIQLLNLLVLIVACTGLDWNTLTGLLVSFYTFCLLVYYVFWKLLKVGELFKKDENEPPLIP